jgi:hypothetical protein
MEGAPHQEKIEIDQLLTLIESKGGEHPETLEKLNPWMDEQQRIIESKGLESPEAFAVAQIKFERDLSRLHLAAGYTDAALQDLYDALDLASGQNMADLVEELKIEISTRF